MAATFLTFQLWNPHKNAADGNVAQGQFRLAFAGQSFMRWETSKRSDYSDPDPTFNSVYKVLSPLRTATFANDYISFNVANGSDNFSQPRYLLPGVAGATSSQPQDTVTALG